MLLLSILVGLCYSTNILDHSYAACVDSPECRESFHLTIPDDPQQRRDFDLVFDHMLKKEATLDFTLPECNNTLTAFLYWGICETAEKLGVDCTRKVNRQEIDDMLTEMDSKKKCGVNR